MDDPDETFTVTLSVPSHARWQPQRRLWQPNVDGMRVAVAGPYGHERVTAWQDGAGAQRKNTAGGFVSSGRARAPDGSLARLSQTTVCDTCGSANAPWPGSRPRGRNGGRTFALSKAQVRLAQAAMAHRDTSVSALCRELGILTAPRAGRPGTAPIFAAGLAEVPLGQDFFNEIIHHPVPIDMHTLFDGV